jgi:hypothetical protein
MNDQLKNEQNISIRTTIKLGSLKKLLTNFSSKNNEEKKITAPVYFRNYRQYFPFLSDIVNNNNSNKITYMTTRMVRENTHKHYEIFYKTFLGNPNNNLYFFLGKLSSNKEIDYKLLVEILINYYMYMYYSSSIDIKKLLTDLKKKTNLPYNIIITALSDNITNIKIIYPDFGTALETALKSIQNNYIREKQNEEKDKKNKAIQSVLNHCKTKKEKYISDLTNLIRTLETIVYKNGINNNKLGEIQKQKEKYQSILDCILATNRQNVPRNNNP